MKKIILFLSLIVFNFSIKAQSQCPQIIAAMIDACNGTSFEGDNEFMMLQNGNSDLQPNQYNIYYSSDNPPSTGSPKISFTHLTATYTTEMSNYIGALNTEAANTGCSGLFATTIPVTGIPANSTFIILSPNVSLVYNLNAYCDKKPIYVLYDTFYNANNGCTGVGTAVGTNGIGFNRCGTFKNDGSSSANNNRYFSVATTSGCADNISSYNYTTLGPTSTPADGAWVSWAADGTPSYLNNGCDQIVIVPVKLTSFEASYSKENTKLFWQTSMEINTANFVIQKSLDGINFSTIGFVAANRNSNMIKNYFYTDNTASKNIQYYRIVTTDIDGRQSYSRIIKLNTTKNTSGKLIVYPQPAKDFVSLEWNSTNDNNATLLLTDMVGRVIKKEPLKSFKGFNKKILQLNGMARGQYILQITMPDNILVQKIITN